MNQGQRILVVTRRFWPAVDESSHRLLGLCSALQRRGNSVSVLTARWHPSWPERASIRELPITRLLPGPTSNWNESYFQKNVVAWITQNQKEFDVIYVDRTDTLLASIASKSNKWNLPIVARFAMDGSPVGIARSQWLAPVAAADACRRCARVVTPNVFVQRVLVSHGIDASRVVRIPDVAWSNYARDSSIRISASSSLFELSSDFVVPGRTDVILHHGPAESKSLLQVIYGICDLLDMGVSLRTWIVGYDLPSEPIYQAIKSRGWHREIMLFHGFDDLQDLISVADLAIVSNPASALQFSAPTMVSADLPLMMLDTVDSRNWLAEQFHHKLYTTDSEFASLVQDWLTHREAWTVDAAAMRSWLRRHESSDRILDQWVTLLQDANTRKPG